MGELWQLLAALVQASTYCLPFLELKFTDPELRPLNVASNAQEGMLMLRHTTPNLRTGLESDTPEQEALPYRYFWAAPRVPNCARVRERIGS